jgi:hypothetical protein
LFNAPGLIFFFPLAKNTTRNLGQDKKTSRFEIKSAEMTEREKNTDHAMRRAAAEDDNPRARSRKVGTGFRIERATKQDSRADFPKCESANLP